MTVSARPSVQCLLVDLDDTLYDCPEMAAEVAYNIRQYMLKKLHMPEAEAEEKCRELYLNFGTTLAGLVAMGHTIDFDDWHAFVHGSLPYEKYLRPDPKLKQLLDSIPVPKYIFTNADIKHAERTLGLLGLRSCFKRIICFENIMEEAGKHGMVHHNRPIICKPNRQAMELALQMADGAGISTTIFFDDSTRNIATSHRLGVYSVLIGRCGVDCASDMQLRSMHDVSSELPWLLSGHDGRPSCVDGDDHRDGIDEVAGSPPAEELREETHRTGLTVRA